MQNFTSLLPSPRTITAVVLVTFFFSLSSPLFAQSTEDKYFQSFEKVTEQIRDSNNKLERLKRMQSAGEQVPADKIDAAQKRLQKLQSDQREILVQLVTIAPENKEYRYELARNAASKGDRAIAIGLLETIAPIDRPGFPQAHYVLAQMRFDKSVSENRLENLEIALKHIDHALMVNQKDLQYKLLKARVLERLERFASAYELYEQLLASNPNYYREMSAINTRIGREERNPQLYERTLDQFLGLESREEIHAEDRQWVVIETGIAKLLQKLGRFEDAEAHLKSELEKATPDSPPRQVFAKRLLADTYLAWAATLSPQNASFKKLPQETLEPMLELYRKANENHARNPNVLMCLTRLSLSDNAEIPKQAKAIYDAKLDQDAPPSVLNQLANHELFNKRYAEAIAFYEKARQKKPKDPAILNNLAYGYLIAPEGERNAERALLLINDAVRNLPKSVSEIEKSKFLHTKATALKALKRFDEAIIVFEEALNTRPKHKDTLQSLVECYTSLNKEPPKSYLARLKIIELEEEE